MFGELVGFFGYAGWDDWSCLLGMVGVIGVFGGVDCCGFIKYVLLVVGLEELRA